jgi:hypothetical protein
VRFYSKVIGLVASAQETGTAYLWGVEESARITA